MQTTSDRSGYPSDHSVGASNNAVIVTLLLALAFGYFGCVRPMTEQVRSMRISLACMQSRVAKLVREADAAGETAGLLARLTEQRAATREATQAIEEIEALNRRLAERSRQIALLANCEDLAERTVQRITEQRELLGAAEQALSDSSKVEQRLVAAQRRVNIASAAAERMKTLCSGLIASSAMVEDAHAASEDMAALQQQLIIASRHSAPAAQAADMLTQLSDRLAGVQPTSPIAVRRLNDLERLESRLAGAMSQNGQARDALDALTDLQNEMVGAEDQLQDLRSVMLQVSLMRPAVDRAVATLLPIRELASLRHLDTERLQVAAKALQLSAKGTVAK